MSTESTFNDISRANNHFRDLFGLDEDGIDMVDIRGLITSDGQINRSVYQIIHGLQFGFKGYEDAAFLDTLESEDEQLDETKDMIFNGLYWKDRIQILKFILKRYKETNLNTPITIDFDFNPFLIEYVNSIMEE